MVGKIYFTEIVYTNFKESKGRPIILIKELENDYLFLPLTSNLNKNGILINNEDLSDGLLRKKSVIAIPKISAIDKNLINDAKYLATIKDNKFKEIISKICNSFGCKNAKK
jgi:hypothetical protein